MWEEALALAQQHLPHRLAEVNMAFQSSQVQPRELSLSDAHSGLQASRGVGGSKNDILSNGRNWERSRQWSNAIDAYLTARNGMLKPDELEEVWDNAVRVARKEYRTRYSEVVFEVSRRLKEIGKHRTAAEVGAHFSSQ